MANSYLEHTLAAAGTNGNKKGTFSAWLKRSTQGYEHVFYTVRQDSNNFFRFRINSDVINVTSKTSGTDYYATTDEVFKDHSAFYHVVIAYDTTQATAANRIRIYVNGSEQTKAASNYPSQDATLFMIASGQPQRVGQESSGGYFDGLMAHVHYTEGYAYAASDFGQADSTSGIWTAKTAPSVTYGTNGFFLKFENSGALGTDSSGNSNTFTVNGNLKQNIDTPTNNFATLNGGYVGGGGSKLTNAGLTYSLSNYSYNTRSTLGFTKGKWYWEQKQSDVSTRIGLITSGYTNDLDTDNTNAYYGTSANGGVYLLLSAGSTSWQRTNNDTSRSIDTYTSAIASSSGSILMGAVDADAGKLWVGVNGVWMNSGDPAAGSNNQITFTNSTPDELQVYAGFGTSNARVSDFNFGQGFFGTTALDSGNADGNGFGSFEYTVPSGFYSICTKNIQEFG